LSSTLKKEEAAHFVSTVLRHSTLPQLEALLFDNNSLTSAGLQELFSLESLVSLKILSVKSNKLTKIEGPFNDLAFNSLDKPLPPCMNLLVLDATGNSSIHM
jgi:hypothetical protein